jgi:ubiquinone/menaquinone biosynthesis C-methylase UbiE
LSAPDLPEGVATDRIASQPPPGAGAMQAIRDFWDRDDLESAVLAALDALVAAAATERPTVDLLAPLDQFHGGGKAATTRLARLAALAPGVQVVDVGGGLGGPARTLAVEHGCRVTVLDLAPSYVRAGAALTARLGLADRVSHRLGQALDLPFADAAFDVVWTQNSGMNVEAKERMVAEFRRVLRPGGQLVFQEPMAGVLQPPVFPLMWAEDPATSFLRTPAQMRGLLEASGFRIEVWDDVTAETIGGRAPPQGTSIQALVMGERLAAIAAAGRRNRDEERIVMVQAVAVRVD